MIKQSLNIDQLERYCLHLLGTYLPDGYTPNYAIRPLLKLTLERVSFCFSHINLKYYREGDAIVFNHLNSDHFATFLYILSNTAWIETQDIELPSRLFYLNKIMHGIDLFYSVKMPDIFLLVHPVGTVLGNAKYNDYFVAYQNVTVGADEAGIYPSFGVGTVLYAKSTVIGECKLGRDVIVAANTFMINLDIPDNTLVVGQYPSCRLIPSSMSVTQRIFNRGIESSNK